MGKTVDVETAEPINNGSAQALKGFVDRAVTLAEEMETLKADNKELMKEIKESGFDTKIVQQIVKLHLKDAFEDDAEQMALKVQYLEELGLDAAIKRMLG